MRSKSGFRILLWVLVVIAGYIPNLNGQSNDSSFEILIEYPDTGWKSSSLVIENGTFRRDLHEFQPNENGMAYLKILLEKPSFANLLMFGKSYSLDLFLWPGDLLHIKFTNSPETETISHAAFQGKSRNIQKFFYEHPNHGMSRRIPDPLDSLNPGNSRIDSIALNSWMTENYSATEPEVYFVEMYKANMFAKKWLSTQMRATNPLYSSDTTHFQFPEPVVTKTKELYSLFPQVNNLSQLATKMGFGNYEVFQIAEMTNCTELRKAMDYSQSFQVRGRLESSSRGMNPRKMTAKDVDFIRDCLFLLRDTDTYAEDLEKALANMYAGLPDASVRLELNNIEPDAKFLENHQGKDSLIILMLYDYYTEDSIFQKPEWLSKYPLSWVAVSLDYTSEKWEDGKSAIPSDIPSVHLKGGITHPIAKAYQWYQFPRLVLYNSKTQRIMEHIMPEYERRDLWVEILSGLR